MTLSDPIRFFDVPNVQFRILADVDPLRPVFDIFSNLISGCFGARSFSRVLSTGGGGWVPSPSRTLYDLGGPPTLLRERAVARVFIRKSI